MGLFRSQPHSGKLGIDIGTSSVKVAALSPKGKEGQFALENYGTLMSYSELERQPENQATPARLTDGEIIAMVRAVLEEMGVGRGRPAIISIPAHTSFITEIVLPKMSLTELTTAITYQARQYVPISISDVELDWQVIEEPSAAKPVPATNDQAAEPAAKEEQLHVLLAAVPKEIIQRHEYIAKEIGVHLEALEIETFSLIRSVIGSAKEAVCLVDLGARNTNISIVVDGFIRINRNIDVAGGELTRVIAQSLGIDVHRSEDMKRVEGLSASGGEQEIVQTMYPVLDKVLVEVERVMSAYQTRHQRMVDRIITMGGTAQLKGLAQYFGDKLHVPITPANPWARVKYPEELSPVVAELAPTFAIALGLAMR